MGEAKRRKTLDPSYGKSECFLKIMIENFSSLDNAQSVFHSAIQILAIRPIAIIQINQSDSKVNVIGIDEWCNEFSTVRNHLALHAPELSNIDSSNTRLLCFPLQGNVFIWPISISEVKKSLDWATQQNLSFDYASLTFW